MSLLRNVSGLRWDDRWLGVTPGLGAGVTRRYVHPRAPRLVLPIAWAITVAVFQSAYAGRRLTQMEASGSQLPYVEAQDPTQECPRQQGLSCHHYGSPEVSFLRILLVTSEPQACQMDQDDD